MNPQTLATIKDAAGNLESALDTFEAILEDANNRPLYQATLAMVEALRHLHAVDPSLLCPKSLERVEELLRKEKPRGRDSFNTGF